MKTGKSSKAGRWYLALACLMLLAGVGAMWSMKVDASASNGQPAVAPMQDVEVSPALSRRIAEWQAYSGRIEAVERVEVRSMVSGTIVAVHFTDGSLVKKGDPLFTIDPRPYAAEVSRAEAQLAAAQSRIQFLTSDLERAHRLVEERAIARSQFDARENAAREAQAQLRTAQANVETARLNLAYTRIAAPVTGRVSRAERTVGNLVSAGGDSPSLTTLVSLSPVYAAFEMDEQTYLRHLGKGARQGAQVPVSLGLADEPDYPRQGVVSSVDNQFDTRSATIRVRARFDNSKGDLVPGLFARLRVGGGMPREAILIDERAVGTDQDKQFVLVVTPQGKVEHREVTLGGPSGPLRGVTQGLQADELVVVNGLQRVKPGDAVRPIVRSLDLKSDQFAIHQ